MNALLLVTSVVLIQNCLSQIQVDKKLPAGYRKIITKSSLAFPLPLSQGKTRREVCEAPKKVASSATIKTKWIQDRLEVVRQYHLARRSCCLIYTSMRGLYACVNGYRKDTLNKFCLNALHGDSATSRSHPCCYSLSQQRYTCFERYAKDVITGPTYVRMNSKQIRTPGKSNGRQLLAKMKNRIQNKPIDKAFRFHNQLLKLKEGQVKQLCNVYSAQKNSSKVIKKRTQFYNIFNDSVNGQWPKAMNLIVWKDVLAKLKLCCKQPDNTIRLICLQTKIDGY